MISEESEIGKVLWQKSTASSKSSKNNNKKKRNTMKNDFANYLMKEQHKFFKNNKQCCYRLYPSNKGYPVQKLIKSLSNI